MSYTVLIADDEPIMRKAMQTLVNWDELDCRLVCTASGGQEVMEYLKTDIPDILILDIRMPGRNGIEIAKYICEEKCSTKVILLTAYADFSYAQSAIKYNVVDYVIKTGAFEGLEAAIEKAKASIQEEEFRKNENKTDVLKENFFKSVFDGTLYQKEEILKRAEGIGIGIGNRKRWLVVTIHFRMEQEKKRDYMYQSLMNFLKMVFEHRMVYGTAIRRDAIAVVLSVEHRDCEDSVYDQCTQIVKMMENFMKMSIYIGISSYGTGIHELKRIFDEAEYAVEEGAFFETSKINRFQYLHDGKKEWLTVVNDSLKELYHFIKKGKKKESLQKFHEIVDCLRNSGCTTNMIFDIGIEIQSFCKKLLTEYGQTFYDIVPYESNPSQKIYQCKHVGEYIEVLTIIIENAVGHMTAAVSKKNSLIYEAEKYIEENYQNSISVSEVSRNVGVSLSYLSRIYKESTGNTLINFINHKKVEKAKEYLSSTDMKIYEIAEMLGFENTTYFSYFFKKNTGLSPKEYKFDEKE
ncbi:MAG: response regulator [Lachnospiraceae bacterium]